MARGERPLEAGDGALLRFAADLRELRQNAGNLTYQQLALRAHYSVATLSTAANGRKLPSLAVTLAYVRACAGDPVVWEQRWREVATEIAQDKEISTSRDGSGDRAPYVGLTAFQLEDTEWFFGRERQVTDLAARLAQQRFVAVFGASGVGKSSLLRAGVAARWLAEAPNRHVMVFTPGSHPLEECAIRFARLTACAPGQLVADLAADQDNLRRTVRQALVGQPDDAEMLIVIDQFEEIFTVCRDAAERAHFIGALLRLVNSETTRCRVILGIRADFYANCTRHPALLEAMDNAQVAVGSMTTEELRQAIVQPAKLANCVLESALLAELIAHADGHDGALPMLSHALLETWHRRRGNTLTLAGFQAAGGIDGALARTAESVYSTLDPHQQQLVKELFLRLTALGEGTEDTKRRTNRAEFPEGTETVLDVLVEARLITLADSTVEIAHEALIGAWPRLCLWLTEDRDALRIHRQLTEAAQGWTDLEHDAGALYRGSRLAVAREWANQERELNSVERAFLSASINLDDADRALTIRRTRRMRYLAIVLAFLLLGVTSVSVIAIQQRQEAVLAQQTAVSRQLATLATTLVDSEQGTAKVLSVEAFRTARTFEARSAVMSMSAHQAYQREIVAHTGAVSKVAFTPNGRAVVSAGRDQTVAMWNSADLRKTDALRGHDTWLKAMALSNDGQFVATGGEDQKLVLWNTSSKTIVATLAHEPGIIRNVAFTPDNRIVAAASENHTAILWDTQQGKQLATLTGHTAQVVGVAFSPDGRTLATASHDHTVGLWDVATLTRTAVLTGHSDTVDSVEFSPDGRTLLTAGGGHQILLWDVATKAQIASFSSATTGQVFASKFSPDGHTVATAGQGSTISVWDVPRRTLRTRLSTRHINVYSVSFDPAGTQLASAGEDGRIALWDITKSPLVHQFGTEVSDLAFSPDGRTLVTANAAHTVAWDTTSRAPHAILPGSNLINSIAFSPDGRTVGVATEAPNPSESMLRLWDLQQAATDLKGHAHRVLDIAFSPDGTTAATVSYDETVILWDVTRRSQLARLSAGGIVNSVAFSPDGRTLATGGHDPNVITLWDVAQRTRKAMLKGHSGWIGTVQFSPDSHFIASASADQTIIVWNADTGEQLERLGGHNDGAFTGVAYSPDGKKLAFSSANHTAILWDLEHRSQIARLTGHTETINNLAFSPDGQTLATASADSTVLLWDIDADRVANQICETFARSLTPAEWAQALPDLPYHETCAA